MLLVKQATRTANIRTVTFAVARGWLEVAERRQRLLRAASDRLDSLGFTSSPLDEALWDSFRTGLLGAGATDRDIDSIAALQARWVVDTAADEPAFEHLADARSQSIRSLN